MTALCKPSCASNRDPGLWTTFFGAGSRRLGAGGLGWRRTGMGVRSCRRGGLNFGIWPPPRPPPARTAPHARFRPHPSRPGIAGGRRGSGRGGRVGGGQYARPRGLLREPGPATLGGQVPCRRHGSTGTAITGCLRQSQAQAGRHGTRHREHRQAARGRDRRACGRRATHGRLLRHSGESPGRTTPPGLRGRN